MLREDWEVAVDEVVVATRTLAEHYARDAEAVDSKSDADLLAALGEAHRAAAEGLGQALRDAGAMPSGPDPEKVDLERLGHRIEALLSDDQRRARLQTRRNAERSVLDAIDEARGHDLQEALDRHLAGLREQAAAHLARLDRALAGGQGGA